MRNILLFLLVIISIGLYGQKQNIKNTNMKRGEELFNIVWEKFRVPQYGLFAEYYPNSHKPSLTYFHQQDKQAKEVSFLWPMSGVFSSVNILLEVDSAKYRPYLDSMVYAVELYLDTTRFPKGYQAYPSQFEKVDRYYDDNGLVGIDYVDAYMLTNNEKYLTKAKEVMAFIESGWSDDLGGGATWLEGVRDQKPACTNGKATVLALKLYNATQDTRYLNYGLKSYNWMMSTLLDDSLHIIWNSLLTKDQITSQVQKHPYTYNTGTMIQSAVHLYKATSNEKYLRDAQKMAEGAYNFFFERLDNGIPLVKDIPWFTVVLYRGFEDLYLINKDPKYINTIRECLDWAWDHARDAEGLPYRDWTGRNKNENKNPKWLLDASCMIELYTRVGILENLNLKSK